MLSLTCYCQFILYLWNCVLKINNCTYSLQISEKYKTAIKNSKRRKSSRLNIRKKHLEAAFINSFQLDQIYMQEGLSEGQETSPSLLAADSDDNVKACPFNSAVEMSIIIIFASSGTITAVASLQRSADRPIVDALTDTLEWPHQTGLSNTSTHHFHLLTASFTLCIRLNLSSGPKNTWWTFEC